VGDFLAKGFRHVVDVLLFMALLVVVVVVLQQGM